MTQLVDPAVARQFERLPPHAIEAEMSVLASMMLDKEMIGEVVQRIDREAFFQADHQVIFDVLLKMYEQNRPVDAVLLREELAKRQLLEEVGGNAYLGAILTQLRGAGLRAELDTSDDRMQKKIRTHTTQKVPFQLIAGENDRSAETVSFRFRDGSQENGVPVAEAVSRIRAAIDDRRQVVTKDDLFS